MDQNVHHKASISRRNPVSAIIANISSTFLNNPPSYAKALFTCYDCFC